MLVVIAAVYALCTLPYHVTWLFSVFGYPNSVAKKLCVLLVIATSAAHPIIYGTLNQEFGRGFKAFFRCLKQKENYQKSLETKMTSRVSNVTYRVASHVKWKENRERTQLVKNEVIVKEMVSCL